MIKQKDAVISQLTTELEASKSERNRLSKEILECRGRIEALTAENEARLEELRTAHDPDGRFASYLMAAA